MSGGRNGWLHKQAHKDGSAKGRSGGLQQRMMDIMRHRMQITDHVHALKIPFQITDPSGQKIDRFVYSYLICGQKIYLIDSGVACSEKIILNYLKATGRSPAGDHHAHPHPLSSRSYRRSREPSRRISGCTVACPCSGKVLDRGRGTAGKGAPRSRLSLSGGRIGPGRPNTARRRVLLWKKA